MTSQPYRTVLHQVDINGRTWKLETLADRQQYHDPDGAFEAAGVTPSMWSLFGVVWPAGLVLAEVMASERLDNLRILEAGCGLALASMVAAHRGGNITATDLHPLAGDFLDRNLTHNSLPPLPFAVANWAEQNELGKFDLVIGSDLLYEAEQPELLAMFVDRHLEEHGEFVLTDPGRKQVGRFNRLMAARGFSHDTEHRGKARTVRYSRSTRAQ